MPITDKFIVRRYFRYLISASKALDINVLTRMDARKLNYAEIDETNILLDKGMTFCILNHAPIQQRVWSKESSIPFAIPSLNFSWDATLPSFLPRVSMRTLKTTSWLYCFKKVHARFSILSRLTFEVKILHNKKAISIRWEPFHSNVDS